MKHYEGSIREIVILSLVFLLVVGGIGFGFLSIIKNSRLTASSLSTNLPVGTSVSNQVAFPLTTITGIPYLEDSLTNNSVRMIALVASPLHQFTSTELRLTDVSRWQALRNELDDRHEARRKQYRFRKSPERYLLNLEEKLIKARLLS